MKLSKTLSALVLRLLVPLQWLFIRLPKPFSVPLILIAGFYFFLVFPYLVNVAMPRYITIPARSSALTIIARYEDIGFNIAGVVYIACLNIILITAALATLSVAVGGVLLSHWLAGKFYKTYRRLNAKPFEAHIPILPSRPLAIEESNDEPNPLARYKRIGIILSGGGAKGAYQAGAMKAIYEFLEKYDAHDNIQMIAATSIGSWNALFWLAGLVKSRDGTPGPLERWWSEVTVQNLILPTTYVPTRQNYLLSNQPWQDNFDAIFGNTEAGNRLLYHVQQPNADDAIRFYFTHSNIGKAHLAFTTNRSDWESVTANLPSERSRPVVAPGTYSVVNDQKNGRNTLENIRTGVFSSMDIPPLFPYTGIDDQFFEDGGVIDNLPIRFGTEVEECDLLFILPLNASFEKKVDQRSLMRRLARVTEVRQGVLERNSFKMIYLYNELASLRQRIAELESTQYSQRPKQSSSGLNPETETDGQIAERALSRTHHVVHVFSICPAPELKISTTEFWKTKEAGEAFRFMYDVTRNELKRFTELVSSNQILMALVSPARKASYNRDGVLPEPTDETRVSTDDYAGFDVDETILKLTDTVAYNVTYFRDF